MDLEEPSDFLKGIGRAPDSNKAAWLGEWAEDSEIQGWTTHPTCEALGLLHPVKLVAGKMADV